MLSTCKGWLKASLPDPLINKLRKFKKKLRNISYYEFVQGPLTYNQDGLATRHNCDFMKDKLFMESYKLGENTGSWRGASIHWRAFILCWAANWSKKLEGDYVECGVNKGGFSRMVMNCIDFKNLDKSFYLLDTYCGLCEEYITEEEKKYGISPGVFEECYEGVIKTFKDFPNVEIIRGAIPGTLPLVKAEKVCYLSIDMNCAEPEIASAEFFWDKLVRGAIIVIDDYGWQKHFVQKIAWDDFANRKNVQVLPLPTGQGLIFKP